LLAYEEIDFIEQKKWANTFLISFLQETWNHTLIVVHHSCPTWRF
jgi:hypothetical protein